MDAILRVLMTLPLPAMVLFKMTILLGLGWVLHFALIRSNPRWRALLWRMVMVCIILLVPAQLFLPELPLFVIKEAQKISAPANIAPAPIPAAPIELQTPSEPLVHLDNILPPVPPKTQISIAAFLEGLTRNWPAPLAITWAALALILSIRHLYTYRRLSQFIKSANPAPESILAAAKQVTSQLECVELPQLRVAEDLASPFVAGFLRPVIVIPETLADEKYRPNLVAVLAHELVHIKSRDLFWMAFAHSLSILLWFHPLMWRMRHAHNMACEQVCDGVAAEISGGAPAYSQTLAQTFLTLVVDAPQPMGAPMLRPSEIMRRIAILKIGLQVKSLKWSWVGLACLAAIIVLAGLGGLRLAEAKEDDAKRQTSVTQTIVTRKETNQLIREQIYVLRHFSLVVRPDLWAPAIKKLSDSGPSAVPDLVAELRRGGEPRSQSTIAFALRAIGDRRAIPALVEALGIVPQDTVSDCGGMWVPDVTLLGFMIQHQRPTNKDLDPGSFGIGQPRNEIVSCLEKLTGHKESLDNNRFLQWPAIWRDWWKTHQQEYLNTEQIKEIDSWGKISNYNAIEEAGLKAFGSYVPYGPEAHFGATVELILPDRAYLDFDSGKVLPSKAQDDYFNDLQRRINYTGPDSNRYRPLLYASGLDVQGSTRSDLQYAGLHNEDCLAWRLRNDRWDTIDNEIQNPLALTNPKEAMWINPADHIGFPQTYLFRTRADGIGIIQILGFDTPSGGVNLRYKMLSYQKGGNASSAETGSEISSPVPSPAMVATSAADKAALKALLEKNCLLIEAIDSSYSRTVTYTGEGAEWRKPGLKATAGYSCKLPYRYLAVDGKKYSSHFGPGTDKSHPNYSGQYFYDFSDNEKYIGATSIKDIPFSQQESYNTANARENSRRIGGMLDICCPIPSDYPVFDENWKVDRKSADTFAAISQDPTGKPVRRLTIIFDLTKAQPVVKHFEMDFEGVKTHRKEVFRDYEYKETPLKDKNAVLLMPTRFITDYYDIDDKGKEILTATADHKLESLEYLNDPAAVRAEFDNLDLRTNPKATFTSDPDPGTGKILKETKNSDTSSTVPQGSSRPAATSGTVGNSNCRDR